MTEASFDLATDTTRRVDWKSWRQVAAFALAYRRDLLGLALAAVVTAGADVAAPLVTRLAIDRIAAGGAAGTGGAAALAPVALAYAACVLALAAGVWTFVRLGGRISSHVAHDIRGAAFDRLQTLSFSYFDRRPTGWLMARMTSDADRLARILAWGTLECTWAIVVLAGCATAMLALAPRPGLAVLAALPAVLGVSVVYQRRILASARAVRKSNSKLTAAFNEAIMGVRTTRVLAREAGALRDFSVLSTEMYRASIDNAVQNAVYLPLVLVFMNAGTAFALVVGGLDLASGALSLGTLLAFLTYSALLLSPVQDLARNFAELQMAGAAAERVMGLIDTVPEIRDPVDLAAGSELVELQPAASGAASGLCVELNQVSFSYGDATPVIDQVSFRAEAGQSIALVGPTGGGKTTLVSLICRFYEPTAGEIRIGGVDYRRLGQARLRANLAVVLQSPHLFTGTVRENIRYGRLGASDAEVESAASEVGAHDIVLGLGREYDTEVGEGGCRLSAGQRQLVSFARAVLARPRILVMDEATSSIDTETEQRIQAALPRVLRGPTSLVIAHRLSTVRSADRILYVAGGRIVESGTHDELLAARGPYHALYRHQRMEQTAEVLS